jgi:hypothetical protein
MGRQKVLHQMVASITRIQSPLNFLLNQIPNMLTVTHFQVICLLFLCPDFGQHSGDKTATYIYFSPCLILAQPPY